jgi:hypothetical protein
MTAAAAAAENAGQRFRVQCSNRQSSKVYTAHLVLLVLPKLKRLALLGSTWGRVSFSSFSRPSMMPRPPENVTK